MIKRRGARRSDELPVGSVGAVAGAGQEAGAAADVDTSAVDRRHTPGAPGPVRRGGTSRNGTGGPWDRAYDLFRRRQRNGTWKRMFEQLQAKADARGLITWDVSVDSTIARAHQHAAGARKKGQSKRSLPAASSPSPTTTASGVHAAD